MKLRTVQILVVVANIQWRTLKAEVEKASVSTAIGHGSVGPKVKCRRVPQGWSGGSLRGPLPGLPKGNAGTFRDHSVGI